MCFNSLTTMQLAVYAFCGLHSLNVLLLPGSMVSADTTCLAVWGLWLAASGSES